MEYKTTETQYVKLPGLCDVHVHFREPGFLYKETIKTGSMSGAAGGYTCVCPMPNLDPVPDCMENLKAELDIIERDACINVLPYGAITVGEKGEKIADLEAMAPYVCAFSDDGHGVQDDGMMKEAMQRAKALHRIIAAHCEDNTLLFGGYIHDGVYAAAHGHKGICSASEWKQIERDVKLADEAGCSYHVCHVSAKESVQVIRDAKKSGVDVTCETGPHYLILCDEDLKEDGWWKMNPPLRGRDDRKALIEGILDGTIDCIATDHAPHSLEEKSKGLAGSAFGIVGLETAFPLLYTHLVKKNVITFEKLTDLMIYAPRKRFNIPFDENDYALWDLEEEYIIDPENFKTKGRATPFAGTKVFGRCVKTVCGGREVYNWNEAC